MQIAGVEVQWLGWILIGIGGVTLVIMICRLFSNKEKPKQTPASEINKRVRERKQHLPQLKQLFENYVNRIESLALNTESLCDINLYKETYKTHSYFVRSISKYDEDQATLVGMLVRWAFKDNILFRKVWGEDSELFSLN